MRNRRNYYRILHVQPDAPAELIQMSYLTLMRRLRLRQDPGGNPANAALVAEAYATLRDPVRRELYDRSLRQRRVATSVATQHDAPLPSHMHLCAFCDTPHSEQAVLALHSHCDVCGSPLHPADRSLRGDNTRRTLDRLDRKFPISFSLPWSPDLVGTGVTEDISIAGMLFTTTTELLPDDRLKIESAFCSAVGIVRHATEVHAHWRVGVEFLTLLVKEAKGGIVSARV
jgi:curved DNA-binding protein CbpA